VWPPQRQTLWWLDIGIPTSLFEWSQAHERLRCWPLPQLAGGLALSDSGAVVVVAVDGIHSFDPERGGLELIAPIPFDTRNLRFNDCGCDPRGRLWTGTMVNDFAADAAREGAFANPLAGRLLCVDLDLSCRFTGEGIGCPNTFAWSLDGTTLYSADSADGCLYSWSYDFDSGASSARRLLANPPALGIPDGSALDAEGCLWNARWDAGCVARFTPDGEIVQTVAIPARRVTSCAFGGAALDTLFVTTARVGLAEQDLAQQPQSGGVFAFQPRVPGTATARFLGRRRG
jgi:L-arabinonolactonase